MLNQQKNSTSGEISQISQVAFLKHILYKRDISDYKRSKHKTFMDDRHLIEDVFNRFHFVFRHFRSTPEEFKQFIFFTSLTDYLWCFICYD